MNGIGPEKAIKNLLGKTPWGVRVGMGSALTMEFGHKDPRQSSVSIHGELHLWLYLCSWRIETGKKILIGSEDERARLKKVINGFKWSEITGVNLKRPSLDLELQFKNRSALRTFSVNSSDDLESDQWILFTPELISISARGGKLVMEEYAAGSPLNRKNKK